MTAAPAATLLVRNIGELATCDPHRTPAPGVIRNAAVLASGETITWVGSERDLPNTAVGPGTVEIDARGAAVIPGLVDCHTHLVWLGDRAEEYQQRAEGRSYEEIAHAGGGIASTVRATAAGTVAELVEATRLRARRMLRGGTTTVEIKSGYGLSLDAELRQLDAALALAGDDVPDVVTTYLPLHSRPARGAQPLITEVCRQGIAAAASRARFLDTFCDAEAFTTDEVEPVYAAGRAAGMGLKIHAEQRSHSGGAALAARLGATSADHLEHATLRDAQLLAEAGVVAVILPGAALQLDGPAPPGRMLLEAGAQVAIATDCNPGTCLCESLPLMMSVAVATAGLTPAMALVGATRSAAAALGLTDRGAVAPGRRCDLVLLLGGSWIDPAYHLGGNMVGGVIRGGRVVGDV